MTKRILTAGCAALSLALASSAAIAAGTPAATTGPATAVTASTATVTGTVNPNGQASSYAFQYGPTTGYGQQTSAQSAGAGTTAQPVTANLAGLPSGTTIHYRIIVTYGTKSVVGNDATFTTAGTPSGLPAPTATTGGATAVGAHGAQLNGVVGPASAGTTYYFEYGLTSLYGVETSPSALTPNAGPQPVKAVLSGLQSGLTYHYRLVTRSSSGLISVGADASFSTTAVGRTDARGLTLNAGSRRTRRSVTVSASGKLLLPGGVAARQACNGIVAVQIKAGPFTVSNRRIPVSRSCTYRERVTIVRSRLHGQPRLSLIARFQGNRVLRAASSPRRTVQA